MADSPYYGPVSAMWGWLAVSSPIQLERLVMFRSMSRYFMVALAMAAFLPLLITDADARVGGSRSFGSRGGRTYNSTPSTTTAPGGAAPVTRSNASPSAPNAGASAAGAAQGSRFGGFGRLLVGGLIGAGLFGLLSGSGLFGGLGSFASIIGLLLQVAVIGGIGWLVWSYFRGRSQPSTAGAGSYNAGPVPPQNANMQQYDRSGGLGGNAGGGFNSGGGYGGASTGQAISIQPVDYQAFERLLVDIQTAYGRGDFNRLAELATPEMLSYFSEDLKENMRNGVRNEIGNVKFLNGDLAEAWTEQDDDYATVAIKYSIVDAMVDISTGRVVEGDRNSPQEITEIWTFIRNHRDMARGWHLSAIQQPENGGRMV